MIQFNTLTIKNFLSIGAVTQTVSLSTEDLILVLGENLDLGGNESKNGTGKTSIGQALSYALFGSALTNIKKDNLINNRNSKGMLVTLKFEVNGTNYTIERGRKPNVFRFIEDGKDLPDDKTEKDSDESQGEGKHTQEEIVRIIGISYDMFRHLVVLNTYVEPFLSLRTNDQRVIIEQLLGITKLSEKAEKLKEESRLTKDEIKEEEFRISAANEANKRFEQNIASLKVKSAKWDADKAAKIQSLQDAVMQFMSVDIDAEIAFHEEKKGIDELKSEYKSLSRELSSLEKDVTESTKQVKMLERVLASSTEKICPTCNQEMDKDTHVKVHNEYVMQHTDIVAKLADRVAKRDNVKVLASTVSEAIPESPKTFYDTLAEAYNHKTTLDTLGNGLASEMDMCNPYTDQIESLQKHGLQIIDFTVINKLVRLKDHQEYLIKLLTNKDSFIRKKIIDQNLTYLNHRLAHYLVEMGLPHAVVFKSDLEVEITMYGKELDFDNLSRGERTRLILSLAWAFREVFESMNDKINLFYIDEILDQGMDTAGAEAALKVLKSTARNGKNVFLISHREEFTSRVDTILKVVKENGFTSIIATDDQ